MLASDAGLSRHRVHRLQVRRLAQSSVAAAQLLLLRLPLLALLLLSRLAPKLVLKLNGIGCSECLKW